MATPDIQSIVTGVVSDTMNHIMDSEFMNRWAKLLQPRVSYWQQRRGGRWAVKIHMTNADMRNLVGYPEFGVKLFDTEELAKIELSRIKILVPDVQLIKKER